MIPTPKTALFMLPTSMRKQVWCPIAKDYAEKHGFDITVFPPEGYTGRPQTEDWAHWLEGFEALITSWSAPRLDSDILKYNNSLKIVGHAAGSVAGIVSTELYRRGIKVISANKEMARSVAEWSLAMTMIGYWDMVRHARFGLGGNLQAYAGPEYRSMGQATIGIWGYGEVARSLIELLKPLCPKAILVHSDFLTPSQAREKGLQKVNFDELFSSCDIIHCIESLTPNSFNRVGKRQLQSIANRAVLINAGRAHLVQEDALITELKRGRFSAILDVFHREPLPYDSELRSLPNVVLTPHCAGLGRRQRYVPCVLDEFMRFFRGEPLKYEITEIRARSMTHENGTFRKDVNSPTKEDALKADQNITAEICN